MDPLHGSSACILVWQAVILTLLWLLPPLAVHFTRMRRRVHWARLRKLVTSLSNERGGSEGGGLWRSMYPRVWRSTPPDPTRPQLAPHDAT